MDDDADVPPPDANELPDKLAQQRHTAGPRDAQLDSVRLPFDDGVHDSLGACLPAKIAGLDAQLSE